MILPQTTYLHSEAVTLQIQSQLPVFTEESDFYLTQAFVPGATFSGEEWDGPVTRTVHIKDSSVSSVELQGSDITVYETWQDKMPLNIVHLLYGIVQQEQLRRQKYSLHSACVIDDGMGYLLVGHSGSGKTTSALEMVSEHGFSWYSGNKTLLQFDKRADDLGDSALQAIAGTVPVTVEASNDVTDTSIFNKDIRVPFVGRELRVLKNKYLHTEAQVAIAGIFFVRVNDGMRKSSQLGSNDAAIPLFPFFYDYFNTDIHLPSGGVFNSGSAGETHTHDLKGQLTRVLKHTPVFQVSGSFKYMAQQIREITEK